ncbi:hypothetical protein [Latilactobacillus fuchuensis]|uniref:Uncharacterized protein n=2 Tax=Latilactobacillus fuchuensis TaxID=164393 RepID=A0A2N9DUQ7_9LACO|nr:hypothetical protein [Latilactobacillus fuchuensis]KRL61456.1 hypothetical protein FC69_GL000673 [Latilactobacillus fuchuensis DSM 14340 = JCM 11249]MCP8857576.1 hypothetical protein [Latilactobacillus fuchuensis]SPC37944.1 conserved hypothetical protein [Latilactobacillus fuchuensis]
MSWFKHSYEDDIKVESHDFNQLLNRARADNGHYQKVQATFADLTKSYQVAQSELNTKENK